MNAQDQTTLAAVIPIVGGWVQQWLHAIKGFPDPLVNFVSIVAALLLCAWANAGHPLDLAWFGQAVLFVGAMKGFSAYSAEAKAAPVSNTR